jgi:monovalent cation:H+ antiporter, CPA1 family
MLNPFAVVAVLFFLVALFSYLNARFLRLPPTVGLMLLALAISLILIGLRFAGVPVARPVQRLLSGIDFRRVLFDGLLGYLLFAGSLQLCLECLAEVRWQIFSLATIGVIGSTLIVGFSTYWLLPLLGVALPLSYCLLFGALISPTDPVAVLPIMRKAGALKKLEVIVSGESLFNDGFGLVVFVVLLSFVTKTHTGSIALHGLVLFLREAVGGLAFGLALGWVGYRILKTIDDYPVEIIITLALVAVGYTGAQALGISGPLAMVVAGIVVGNVGRQRGMSAKSVENLDRFWEMVDIILNGIIFVLIGLEVLVFAGRFSDVRLAAALLAIPVVLIARFISVGVPMSILKPAGISARRAIPLITWGGLRGAIPVALALSLPESPERDVIMVMTYVAVVFSILVQGTTVQYLADRPLSGPRQSEGREEKP